MEHPLFCRGHYGIIPALSATSAGSMRVHRSFVLAVLLFASSMAGAAEVPPAPARRAVGLHLVPAEYPAVARRYNISGTVHAKMRIEPDGSVSKVEVVQSPADVLSEAVVKAAGKWKYQPLPEALEAVAPFPFKLTGDDGEYAFSTDLRTATTPAPANVQEIGFEAREEWSDVRALINGDGTMQSVYVLKGSSDKAGKIAKKIISSMRFSPAPEGITGYKATTVNSFFIRVAVDGAITIDHKSGV